MRRALVLAGVAAFGAVVIVGVGSSAHPRPPVDRAAMARHLAATRQGALLSAPAQTALAIVASGDRRFGSSTSFSLHASHGRGTAQASGSSLSNVRVNDPGRDRFQVDQTTQSETSLTVSRNRVVVGYNDSQQALPSALTPGADLNGYSYSTNGGASFTDGGNVPNLPGLINFGDPWLAADRSGGIYYSSLALDGESGSLDVAVSKSKDGGRTWTQQAVASPSGADFYFGDKDAMTVGPDPSDTAKDVVYVAWDDQFSDEEGNAVNGLPVARSTDGGQTWDVTYADQIALDPEGCSFTQYIGAVPAVASNGTLYVAAEKFSIDDPDCTGENQGVVSEVLFTSNDAGQSFDSGTQLAEVTEVGDLDLGPGRVMRNLEFPSIAVGPTGNVYVAWNDGESGNSNVRLATSTDGGSSWDLSWVTSGANDSVQPAISADSRGVHVLYYQRNADATLDALVSNSTGSSWTVRRVTATSFPGALTAPNFDPIIAFGYMGDYIANVSDGRTQYFAWGDNRHTVTNFMYPGGRADPDVMFAKQG